MTEFASAVIEAQVLGTTISYVELVRFMFKSGEVRVQNGFGPFVDGNGERWEGLGGLGQMGVVSAGQGQAIDEMTFSLAGTAAMLANLEADAAEAAGRDVYRYLQFCDVRDRNEAGVMVKWTPVSTPFVVFWGKMGALKVERPKVEGFGNVASSRVISVSAVNAFVNRKKPAYGFFSHRDQQARSSTDNIFVNASRMANATAPWPHGLT